MAGLNAGCIVATGFFQFNRFFDRCFCNSSIMGLGKHTAYVVISLVSGDIGGMRAAQICGFFLAAETAMIFAGFVTLFIDPRLPP